MIDTAHIFLDTFCIAWLYVMKTTRLDTLLLLLMF